MSTNVPSLGESVIVEKLLGRGGMGEVWSAIEKRTGRTVALKVARTDLEEADWAAEQFERELDILAQLKGVDAVPELIRRGKVKGRPYALIRHVAGPTLREAMRQCGRPTLPVASAIVRSLLEAVSAVHAQGVTHRDLKPANLMLENGQVKLIDFGVAAHMDDADTLDERVVVGTTGYMSPEHLLGAKCEPVSVDLWSIAVVAYELLTGHRPFAGPGVREVCGAVLKRRFELPSKIGVASAQVDAFFERAFAPRLDERFQNLEVFLAAWNAVTGPSADARSVSRWLENRAAAPVVSEQLPQTRVEAKAA